MPISFRLLSPFIYFLSFRADIFDYFFFDIADADIFDDAAFAAADFLSSFAAILLLDKMILPFLMPPPFISRGFLMPLMILYFQLIFHAFAVAYALMAFCWYYAIIYFDAFFILLFRFDAAIRALYLLFIIYADATCWVDADISLYLFSFADAAISLFSLISSFFLSFLWLFWYARFSLLLVFRCFDYASDVIITLSIISLFWLFSLFIFAADYFHCCCYARLIIYAFADYLRHYADATAAIMLLYFIMLIIFQPPFSCH